MGWGGHVTFRNSVFPTVSLGLYYIPLILSYVACYRTAKTSRKGLGNAGTCRCVVTFLLGILWVYRTSYLGLDLSWSKLFILSSDEVWLAGSRLHSHYWTPGNRPGVILHDNSHKDSGLSSSAASASARRQYLGLATPLLKCWCAANHSPPCAAHRRKTNGFLIHEGKRGNWFLQHLCVVLAENSEATCHTIMGCWLLPTARYTGAYWVFSLAGNKQRNNLLYWVEAICTLYPLHGGQCVLCCDQVVFSLRALNHGPAIHSGWWWMTQKTHSLSRQKGLSFQQMLSSHLLSDLFHPGLRIKGCCLGHITDWMGFMFRSP